MSAQRPYGRHYPTWIRKIVLADLCWPQDLASQLEHCVVEDKIFTWPLETGIYSPGRPGKLSTQGMS
jgi:hypothetical protein